MFDKLKLVQSIRATMPDVSMGDDVYCPLARVVQEGLNPESRLFEVCSVFMIKSMLLRQELFKGLRKSLLIGRSFLRKPHPSTHQSLIVFVVGGMTFSEARDLILVGDQAGVVK